MDVVRRDVVGPQRHVGHRLVAQPEQPAGHVEQALPHPVEPEVGADLLGVDVVLLLAHQLLVVGAVGGVDRGGVGHVAAVALQERLEVAAHRLLGGRGDPVDELRDRRALADHLHVGVVRRPVVVADQRRQLVAEVEELGEQRLVLRPAARSGTAR